MGSVWLARQTEPVKRYVAVKLIKAGMDSQAVLARFDAERQALGDHGPPEHRQGARRRAAPNGRPFFVMELVKGVPITEYCDRSGSPRRSGWSCSSRSAGRSSTPTRKGSSTGTSSPERAHRPVRRQARGEGHRLRCRQGDGRHADEHTIDTGFGGVVGTPQYMSPEQASFDNLDIDTRSDVYALGRLAVRIADRHPAVSKQDLEKRGILEMLRVVREEEPPRPSNKLSTLRRPTNAVGEPRHRAGQADGSAQERSRLDRDEGAGKGPHEALRDRQRVRGGRATVPGWRGGVGPPTEHELPDKKFVRRNKGQVIAASLVVLALLAGIGGTTWGLIGPTRPAS